MDPREFLQLATALVGRTGAAELRTAISRAYYATYNVSVELLKTMAIPISAGPAGHGQVATYLHNSGDPEMQKVGSQFADLHSKRIRADYRMNRRDVENPKTAQALIAQANMMMQTVDTCRSEPKFSQIRSAIESYQRQITRPR